MSANPHAGTVAHPDPARHFQELSVRLEAKKKHRVLKNAAHVKAARELADAEFEIEEIEEEIRLKEGQMG